MRWIAGSKTSPLWSATFAEKADTPDAAIRTLGHVMNNFDRSRGISIDYPAGGGGHIEVKGLAADTVQAYATEFTSWTSLSDLQRKLFFVRDYSHLNCTYFDLSALAGLKAPKVVPLSRLGQTSGIGRSAF